MSAKNGRQSKAHGSEIEEKELFRAEDSDEMDEASLEQTGRDEQEVELQSTAGRRMSPADRRLAKIIGRQLRALRLALGLTLEEVGDAVGMHFTSLAGYERGERLPSVSRLQILADFYKVPLDTLFGRHVQSVDPGILRLLPPEIRDWMYQNDALLYIRFAHDVKDLPLEALQSLVEGLREVRRRHFSEKGES